ncbi:Thioredoxin [Burkholderia sp. IT-111MI5]
MVPAGVDPAAFDAFDMQALAADTFDAGIEGAGDALAVVFFWGVDCFNCEIAKKAMLAQPDAIRALDLKWFHCNVYEHHQLGRRFGLHGVPTWFFFHRGKRSAARRAGMASRSSRRPFRRRARRSRRQAVNRLAAIRRPAIRRPAIR